MEGGDRQEQQQCNMQSQLKQEQAERKKQLIQQLPNKQCPRCDSMDTQFGYFNNNDLSQERYICKSCKRHWTHGGTLRNVPEGSAARNQLRARASISSGVGGGGPYKITRVYSLDELVSGVTSAVGGNVNNFSFAQGFTNGLVPHIAGQSRQPVHQSGQVYEHNPNEGFRLHPHMAAPHIHHQGQIRTPVQQSGQFCQQNFDQGFQAHQNNPIGIPSWSNPWGFKTTTVTGSSSSHNGVTRNENIILDNNHSNNQTGDTSGSLSSWPSHINWSGRFPGNGPPTA